VLVDGQEVIGKISGSVDPANVLVDDIDRIEIVKGAASAVYGSDAPGGVVNILTRTATQPLALSAEQRFESLGGRTSLVSAGRRAGRWSGLFSASRVARDAYDLVPSEPTTTGSAYRKIGVNGKALYRFGTATDLSVISRYYDEDAADVTVSRGIVYDDQVFDDRWQTIAELRTKPVAAGSLTVRGHVTRYTHDFERVTRSTSAAATDVTRERIGEVEAQYDHAIGPVISFLWAPSMSARA
jgi:outer membrane receptor protein involved in Fe transport